MALTTTPPADLGSPLPAFTLTGVDGQIYSDQRFRKAKALVVMFICNHCPYVQAIEERILTLARAMITKGVDFVGVCSNDAQNYPDDSFANLKKRAEEKNYPFPYLYDETQQVARLFGAVCTPDFFIYDGQMKLAYRGRLDDSWKDPAKVQHQELRQALDAILDGRPVPPEQKPSMGCSIKWLKESHA